jgi:hypothetical protein
MLLDQDQTSHLAPVVVPKVLAGLLDSLHKRLLPFSDPYTRVVLLLVRLVRPFGIADLGHEVVLLFEDEVSDAGEVGELMDP